MTIPTWQLLAQIDRIHELQALNNTPESPRPSVSVGEPLTALRSDPDDPAVGVEDPRSAGIAQSSATVSSKRARYRVPDFAISIESLHRLIGRR